MSQPDPSATALQWVRARSAPGQELAAEARVALHFHPGADASGAGVLASILDCGQYASQFVTGTSNGGLTAFLGGDRWHFGSRETSVEPKTVRRCTTDRSMELLTSTATPMVRHRDSGRPT